MRCLLLGLITMVMVGCSSGQYFGSERSYAPQKGTSRPYKIKGVWYYPQSHYEYNEMGIASWYGPGFHKKKTATGETFDQNQVSAAHKTVPLPCVALVTNLENGRMLKVKVNDRGPFVSGRIIDLSKKGAELLGFLGKGTAKVRVETLVEESIALNAGTSMPAVSHIPFAAAPVAKVKVKPFGVSKGLRKQPLAVKRATPPISSGLFSPMQKLKKLSTTPEQGRAQNFRQIYIQVGTFSKIDNATRLVSKLTSVGRTFTKPAYAGARPLHVVQMGPFANVGKADGALQVLFDKGYKDAKIIVD